MYNWQWCTQVLTATGKFESKSFEIDKCISSIFMKYGGDKAGMTGSIFCSLLKVARWMDGCWGATSYYNIKYVHFKTKLK